MAKEEPESFERAAEKYTVKRTADKALYDLNADVLETMKTNKPVPVAEGGAAPTNVRNAEARPSFNAPKRHRAKKVVSKTPEEELLS